MSNKIDTKNVPSGKTVNKAIQPGNIRAQIHDIWFKREEYVKERNEYNLYMQLEGESIGESWVGFDKVFGDPSKGKFSGPAARVKALQYNTYDGVSPGGYDVSIKNDVLGVIKNICEQTGAMQWWENIHEKYETIAMIVDAFNKEKPYKGVFLNWCLGARVYKNKNNYDAYDLFVVRSVGGKHGFSADSNKVMKFDEEKHLRRPKPKELKDGFEATAETSKTEPKKGMTPNTSFTDQINADHKAQQNKLAQKEVEKMPEGNDIATGDESDLPFDID